MTFWHINIHISTIILREGHLSAIIFWRRKFGLKHDFLVMRDQCWHIFFIFECLCVFLLRSCFFQDLFILEQLYESPGGNQVDGSPPVLSCACVPQPFPVFPRSSPRASSHPQPPPWLQTPRLMAIVKPSTWLKNHRPMAIQKPPTWLHRTQHPAILLPLIACSGNGLSTNRQGYAGRTSTTSQMCWPAQS